MCLLSFLKWGSIGYSLGIVQWDFIRRDHPGNPERVSGSGLVTVPEAFRGTISETIKTIKEFIEEIKNRFAKNEKSETSTLLENLISIRYKGNGNIREYIMEMSHLASKLRAHKLDLSEDFLVHFVLISLPTQFSQFKVSYNCQKETWSLNELISHCVQEK